MSFSNACKGCLQSLRFCRWFFVLVLIVTLAAGLNPKDFHFKNDVTWIDGRAGIMFGEYGIVFAEKCMTHTQAEALNRDGFTLAIAFESGYEPGDGLKILAQFYAGSEKEQLIIWQWREQVIVMNGEDYDYRHKEPRIAVSLSDSLASEHLVEVTCDNDGTRIYLDGELKRTEPNLQLRFPAGKTDMRLMLGNSVFGNLYFGGQIFGFAVLRQALNPATISTHYDRWQSTGDFTFLENEKTSLSYIFDEKAGSVVRDHSGQGSDLTVPVRMTPPNRRMLGHPFDNFRLDASFVSDVVINLFGFVPFGIVVALLLSNSGGLSGTQYVILSVLAGTVFSFGIEFTQSWLPSRNSSLLDLIFNVAGTLLGALVIHGFKSRTLKRSQ